MRGSKWLQREFEEARTRLDGEGFDVERKPAEMKNPAMTATRDRFATRVDHDLLAGVRALAKAEGRPIQGLVDEAFADLLEKHGQSRARPHVMAAYRRSHAQFGSLYKKLAK